MSFGIYTNYQLNNRHLLPGSPKTVSTEGDSDIGQDNPGTANDPDNTDSSHLQESEDDSTWWDSLITRATNPGEPETSDDKPSSQEIMDIAETQLGRPVEKSDLLKVGAVCVKRLSNNELSFIYRMMKNSDPSSDDIQKAKDILQDKLTDEELKLVQEVAIKYGKKINFASD